MNLKYNILAYQGKGNKIQTTKSSSAIGLEEKKLQRLAHNPILLNICNNGPLSINLLVL